jgi:hypothetical protein
MNLKDIRRAQLNIILGQERISLPDSFQIYEVVQGRQSQQPRTRRGEYSTQPQFDEPQSTVYIITSQ